nr:MAG TPA: hypothetical protein [Caudoviricetes sp.]
MLSWVEPCSINSHHSLHNKINRLNSGFSYAMVNFWSTSR